MRHEVVTETFVALSDMLVDDLDVAEFLDMLARRCVHLLDAREAGVMLADDRGVLRLLAAPSEHARLVELFELESAPGVACFATGLPVSEADLAAPDPRWAAFARRANTAGFGSAHALPMRLRGETVGVLNLFRDRTGPLSAEDLRLGQALANVATVGLLHHRPGAHRRVLAEQLQHVLSGRVDVERAKGVLAERLGVDVDTALEALRRHAARTGRRLSAVAAVVVNGDHVTAAGTGPADPILLIRRFDIDSLRQLRELVTGRLAVTGLDSPQQDKLLLAIHEAAVNAVRHGGGAGRLWLWRHDDTLWCEISDDGPGLPGGFTLPTDFPEAHGRGGRGLWLMSQVCPDLQITNTSPGVRLLLSYPLGVSAPLPSG